MKIDAKIKNKKLRYNINRETALTSGKNKKYEYLTGEINCEIDLVST